MKVKFLKGDEAGNTGFIDHSTYQGMMLADPDSVEVLDGNEEELVDDDEVSGVRRDPTAALDIGEEPTREMQQTSVGHGADGPDALRTGESTVQRDGEEETAAEAERLSSKRSGARKKTAKSEK